MAVATYGVNHPLAVKIWSKRMDVETLPMTVLSEYMGSSKNSLIQEMTETRKGEGDRIRFGIRMLAVGEGRGENEVMEGNEEGLTRYTDELIINSLRHAHRARGEGTIDVQRIPYNLRDECFESLRDWWAGRLDTCGFNQLAGNTAVSNLKFTGFNAPIAPSSGRIIRKTGLTTDEAVGADSTATFKLSMIDAARNRAALNTAGPIIRPLSGLGRDVDFVCFIHPNQTLGLRTDTATAGNWFDLQGKRLQGGEGDRNGLYTGMLGVYNRTLIVENLRVPQGVHSTTGQPVANTNRAIFCGAQAMAAAYGKAYGPSRFKWTEEDFDYDEEFGVQAKLIFGMKKTTYNTVDYGTIVISTYAAPA